MSSRSKILHCSGSCDLETKDADGARRTEAEAGTCRSPGVRTSGRVGVDAMDSEGRTALLYAVKHNHERCLAALIEAGADPDGESRDLRSFDRSSAASYESSNEEPGWFCWRVLWFLKFSRQCTIRLCLQEC